MSGHEVTVTVVDKRTGESAAYRTATACDVSTTVTPGAPEVVHSVYGPTAEVGAAGRLRVRLEWDALDGVEVVELGPDGP